MRTLEVMLAPCGTVLAVLGFAVLPSGLLLGWAVIALTVGGLAAHIARDAHATGNPGGRLSDAIPHRSPRRIAGVTAVLTYLTVPVLAGTAALLGAAAASTVAVLAVVLAAATLWARRTKHHRAPFIADPAPERPAPDGEHRPPTAAGVAPDALSALSTPQRCASPGAAATCDCTAPRRARPSRSWCCCANACSTSWSAATPPGSGGG